MLAQNHSTLRDHTRPVYGLHIAHGLSVWGLWVRMSSKVSFSSHLWIYDFPRFSRNHWKSSKLYPYRQGTPHPAARHTHTHTYLGILGGRGLLEMYYPECTPPVSWRNERWREGPAGGRREQHGSQLPCPESILCSCSWMGGWPQGLRHPSGTKNFKAHQEKLCFWAGCFQSSLPLKS